MFEDIDKNVRADDFVQESIWHELVKRNGAKPYLDLFLLAGGEKLYVPGYDHATKPARKRQLKKRWLTGQYRKAL